MSANILVVDDESGIRELLAEILVDEGYTVALAANATEARAARAGGRPDLVLLDIWMPDTDGVTLLKEWARTGLLDMPVVMMSGHATIDTAVEATRVGAADFLEKPVALARLLESGAIGQGFGLAEICTGTVLRYLAVRFAEHPWRQEYPALAALSDRLEARPSFAATTPMPQNIVEAVV